MLISKHLACRIVYSTVSPHRCGRCSRVIIVTNSIHVLFLSGRDATKNRHAVRVESPRDGVMRKASDSRPEGLCSMPDATKYPPSTHGPKAEPFRVGQHGECAIGVYDASGVKPEVNGGRSGGLLSFLIKADSALAPVRIVCWSEGGQWNA
ncbi:hypothetical protein TNCV_1338591 [Trichonephila clavipes]|nr:hypothetical protein TNCV_1338591 [Trichonephila clavipes]